MRIKEPDCVVLTKKLPKDSLEAGAVGTVVHIHRGGAAYEVEFVTLAGNTVTVATVALGRAICAPSATATSATCAKCRRLDPMRGRATKGSRRRSWISS